MVGRKPGKLVGRSPSGVQVSLSALSFISIIILFFVFVYSFLVLLRLLSVSFVYRVPNLFLNFILFYFLFGFEFFSEKII